MSYYGGNYFGANYFGPNYFGEVGTAPATSPLRPALAAILAGDSGVAALAGSQIYFGAAPQTAALPWVAYRISGRSYGHTLGGTDGSSLATVEIDVAGTTEANADALAIAIRGALDCIAPGTYSGTYISRSLLADESDEVLPPRVGGGQWTTVVQLTFEILHRV